ncbi:hypothetical protein HMPREF9153_0797 [Cutibacterium avidum ATCC 25577]|uniref:Uncharacterized protein n=1 Tax=Cutibacterium avidum ATCC 25577 TaxID=997355 RepID=G4CW90_9ACTN|nr:hypothetical protein HMPREF9153_0797 [Cutibacterium avidum ATCC 25577]
MDVRDLTIATPPMEDDMVNNASKLSVMAIGSLVAISIYSTPA